MVANRTIAAFSFDASIRKASLHQEYTGFQSNSFLATALAYVALLPVSLLGFSPMLGFAMIEFTQGFRDGAVIGNDK